MGPRQFHKDFVGRDQYDKTEEGKCHLRIEDIPGDRLGVDASGIMYRKMGTPRGAAPFDMTPEVPLFEALNAVIKDLRSLSSRSKKEITIFLDGRSHPMKAGEEKIRNSERVASAEELQAIYSANMAEYEEVRKLRTHIVKRREDFSVRLRDECRKLGMCVVRGPFEADWQLVEAQRAKLIDIIVNSRGQQLL